MSLSKSLILLSVFLVCTIRFSLAREDVWSNVKCNQVYKPDYCNYTLDNFTTVDDYDRCAPARLTLNARNYFLAASGRRITYKDNKDAYDRIRIQPKMLRDVSDSSTKTTVLGSKVDFPIGFSPVALHKLVVPEGEKATVAGLSSVSTVMILSSLSTTLIEDVAAAAANNRNPLHLWMQVYIFKNRSITEDLVKRAERSGYKAIVLTADSPVAATISCNAHVDIDFPPGVEPVNVNFSTLAFDPSITFRDITWLKGLTKLPIVAKGLLSGGDAVRAIMAGASAILVSNHGGRQQDGDLATIDALPAVVAAMNGLIPRREVYIDGGVRSGNDVYKAIALGAKMVFVGRPMIWGLAMGGAEGVRKVITTLKTEFNETMLLAGNAKISEIGRDTLILPNSMRKSSFSALDSDTEDQLTGTKEYVDSSNIDNISYK